MSAFRLVLVLWIFALVVAPLQAQMSGGLPVGEVAPDVEVTPINQAPRLLSSIQGDKVFALFVFRTTCPHCQQSVPSVNEAFAKLDHSKVVLLAVGLRETPDTIKKFVKDYGVTYPIAIDPTGKMGRPFNLQAVPTHFFLDRKRVVRYEGHGISADEIVSKMKELVATHQVAFESPATELSTHSSRTVPENRSTWAMQTLSAPVSRLTLSTPQDVAPAAGPRSEIKIDKSIVPRPKSSLPGYQSSAEQCGEFVYRYFSTKGRKYPTNYPTLGQPAEYVLAGKYKPNFPAYKNGSSTPPRAGDILTARGTGGRYHTALIWKVEPNAVWVYHANVPLGNRSAKPEDHIMRFPLQSRGNGTYFMPTLQTSKLGYKGDMDVVGWIHPTGSGKLPA